jgi:hypothetical protein
MKRALIPIALTLAAFLAACTSGGVGDPAAAPDLGVETPASSPASSPVREEASAIDGMWRAGPYPASRVAKALDASGLGEWTDDLDIFQGSDPHDEFVYELELRDGSLLMAVTLDGKPLGPVDRETFEVDGHSVSFSDGYCRANFRWTLTSGSLILRLVEDNCQDFKGTPVTAYLTALYAAVPFERAS